MGRKKARENAFKCIYEYEFDKKIDINKILKYCHEENNSSQEEIEYINNVVIGIKHNIDNIDKIILEKLKNWSINRISKVDLAILRLAIYEIKFIEDIPLKVTANESVELAKLYGDQNSKSFVNGVIAKVIKDIEEEK